MNDQEARIALAGRMIMDRLQPIPGRESVAQLAAELAAEKRGKEDAFFGPDDEWGLDAVAHELRSKNSALFQSESGQAASGPKSAAQMSATEREAELRRKHII